MLSVPLSVKISASRGDCSFREFLRVLRHLRGLGFAFVFVFPPWLRTSVVNIVFPFLSAPPAVSAFGRGSTHMLPGAHDADYVLNF